MKCRISFTKHLSLLAVTLAVCLSTTSSAFANRDPGPGGMFGPTPSRLGRAGIANQYADGMNLYQYVRSNPIRYTDPSGLYTYFVIFYEADKNKSFERAADTWIKDLQASKDYNKDCDEVVRIGVTTEADFVKAWTDIDAKVAARKGTVPGDHYKVKVGIIFSHASRAGTSGLEFKPDPATSGSGTLSRPDIKALKTLEWLQTDSELRLQGCNTGLPHVNKSESVASAFAGGQLVTTYGQAGYAYFSEDATKYVEIDKKGSGTSTTVYLKAYERGANAGFWGGSSAEMPPIRANPPAPPTTGASTTPAP
ncbi:MAG: hypothetical protein ACYC26_11795 [Phycisphaerales bacterium]